MSGTTLRFQHNLVRFGRYIRDRCAIDTRTLALFRISLGVLIIGDVIARANRFSYFYTEDGVVPQQLARDLVDGPLVSIFFLTTNSYVTAGLFALHAAIAVQLILGYKTRLATILSFLFVISLDNRNPLVLSYADALFRLLLFWAMFLPLGERWSVDAVHRRREPRVQVTGIASAAILIQMFYMYFGNGVLKAGSPLWRSGEATPLVFGFDQVTWGLAPYLGSFPELLSIGGWIWFVMLLWASWLLLLSAGRVRTLLVIAFIIVHFSFAITVRIGAFPYVAIAGVVLFLQTPFWEDLKRVRSALNLEFSLLRLMQSRVRALAERFPRLEPLIKVPRAVLSACHHSILAAAVLAVLVLPPLGFLQTANLISYDIARVQAPFNSATRALAIFQPPWTIFAPMQEAHDRYYVFAAETTAGSTLDLHNFRPLTYERPDYPLHRQYGHYRERFYLENMAHMENREPVSRALGGYLCDLWSIEHGVVLRQVDMYVVREEVTFDTITDPEGRHRSTELLYQHGCDADVVHDVSPPSF